MNVVIMTMGGSGTRFGAEIPKQYTLINDIPIFAYILRRINELKYIDKIIIVSNPDFIDYTNSWVEKINADKVYKVVKGGASRSESVFNGLKCAKEISKSDEDIVLIHDATHPYVDEERTLDVINAVKEYGAASLVSCEYDTVYLQDEDNNLILKEIPKKKVVVGASPEGFRLNKLYDIYDKTPYEDLEKMSSAGVIALENGMQMKAIPTNILNLKITYSEDMKLFKKLYNNYFFEENSSKKKERR